MTSSTAKRRSLLAFIGALLCVFGLAACGSTSTPATDTERDGDESADSASDTASDGAGDTETDDAEDDAQDDVAPDEGSDPPEPSQGADVTAVTTSGAAGSYNFSVTLSSPDTGCSRYADWWEVLSEDGALLYRRVLGHSHVDEQPFTRSGGPVPIEADAPVFVRAHMNDSGYGGDVFSGSVAEGFALADPQPSLPPRDEESPLPTGCAF